MLCYCYGSVSGHFGLFAFNKFGFGLSLLYIFLGFCIASYRIRGLRLSPLGPNNALILLFANFLFTSVLYCRLVIKLPIRQFLEQTHVIFVSA